MDTTEYSLHSPLLAMISSVNNPANTVTDGSDLLEMARPDEIQDCWGLTPALRGISQGLRMIRYALI